MCPIKTGLLVPKISNKAKSRSSDHPWTSLGNLPAVPFFGLNPNDVHCNVICSIFPESESCQGADAAQLPSLKLCKKHFKGIANCPKYYDKEKE